jgi:hypothetical protein
VSGQATDSRRPSVHTQATFDSHGLRSLRAQIGSAAITLERA